jgi:L-threonylcarbamoyladenylate synthase
MQEEIKRTLTVLRSGGIILYPTDTVWGIGCDATNEHAVKRIFEIKRRIDSKSMIILIDNPAKLQSYVDEVPDIAWDLIELSEKPLTIIYPKAKNLAPGLVAVDGSIGIRVTNEIFSRTLCARFRNPIVSTSANISGNDTPISFNQISDEIKSKMDYIVNYRQDDLTKSKPSSILKLGTGNLFELIRE